LTFLVKNSIIINKSENLFSKNDRTPKGGKIFMKVTKDTSDIELLTALAVRINLTSAIKTECRSISTRVTSVSTMSDNSLQLEITTKFVKIDTDCGEQEIMFIRIYGNEIYLHVVSEEPGQLSFITIDSIEIIDIEQ